MPIHPNARRCVHIKLNQKQCGSPAITGEPYCRLHRDVTQRRRELKIPSLQSAADVQQAITETIRAMLEGTIDRRLGSATLFGLQLAQNTLRENLNRHVALEPADAGRSVIGKIVEETTSVQEAETELDMQAAEEAAEAQRLADIAAAESARAAEEAQRAAEKAARESILDADGKLRTWNERFPPPPQPHHWTDDIPRDDEGYLKPTRKQEAEIERWVMEGNHRHKKSTG